jgi:hypothetical protein
MKKSVASRENIIIFIVVTFVTPSPPNCVLKCGFTRTLGWFKNPVSSQTGKLIAATKFSDYLGVKHYKRAKEIRHFNHLVWLIGLMQSFSTYHSISPYSEFRPSTEKYVPVM